MNTTTYAAKLAAAYATDPIATEAVEIARDLDHGVASATLAAARKHAPLRAGLDAEWTARHEAQWGLTGHGHRTAVAAADVTRRACEQAGQEEMQERLAAVAAAYRWAAKEMVGTAMVWRGHDLCTPARHAWLLAEAAHLRQEAVKYAARAAGHAARAAEAEAAWEKACERLADLRAAAA